MSQTPVRLVLFLWFACQLVAFGAEPTWTVLSGPATPEVSYALGDSGTKLELAVRVAIGEPPAGQPAVSVGWWDGQTHRLASADAKATTAVGTVAYRWQVPMPADDVTPRFALTVSWPGGVDGQPRRIESFRLVGTPAPHDLLPSDPQSWQPLDLSDYRRLVADRQQQLGLDLTQPMDGKLTVVINDDAGNRVRNLLSVAGGCVDAREQEIGRAHV